MEGAALVVLDTVPVCIDLKRYHYLTFCCDLVFGHNVRIIHGEKCGVSAKGGGSANGRGLGVIGEGAKLVYIVYLSCELYGGRTISS